MDKHSPTPWRVEPENHDYPIRDANGSTVAMFVREADAALIVEAVNYYKPDLHCDWRELTPEDAVAHCREVATRLGDTPCARDHLQLAAWIEERARLRDIVRRLCDELESHYHEPALMDDPCIIREAREALGEAQP